MSTSRLEKFIYAICSMEVSDLPAPLSRIEILWNCLITGETPDFEPQSRNEQYLMAMLGLYELDKLPTPMSRGEKLLYKIAMGETDLSDIPAYLSRYEELLGYLAENGGVGDFEYILQTLNQRLSTLYSTKERPMKQAVIKGDTIVNELPRPSLKNTMTNITSQKLNQGYDNGKTLVNIKGEKTNLVSDTRRCDFLIPLVKANTVYLIKYNITVTGGSLALGFLNDTNTWSNNLENAPTNGIIKLNSGNNPNYFRCIVNRDQVITVNNLMIIEYQDGMENWDIPYFEGTKTFSATPNVVDGEFKSAILKGQTLVNLVQKRSSDFTVNLEAGKNAWSKYCDLKQTLVAGKKYFIAVTVSENTMTTGGQTLYLNNGNNKDNQYSVMVMNQKKGYLTSVFTANFDTLKSVFVARESHTTDGILTIKNDMILCEYQEGMENWDIPYFEGMQSVQLSEVTTTGKNLFTGKNMSTNYIERDRNISINDNTNSLSDYIKVEPSTSYAYKCFVENQTFIYGEFAFYDEDKKFISVLYAHHDSDTCIITPDNCHYLRVWNNQYYNNGESHPNAMLVKTTNLPSTLIYEPYQSNTLTLAEPVNLRKVGDVEDEFDALTGQVTERISEVVLNGSEQWRDQQAAASSLRRFVSEFTINNAIPYRELTDRFPTNGSQWNDDVINLCIDEAKKIVIQFKSSDDRYSYTVGQFKQWLSQNPVTIQYQLKTPTTKTVNTTITDQDGATQSKLHSFNDGHLSVSSQGLLPSSVNYEVPTNNSYYLPDMLALGAQYTSRGSADCNATIDGKLLSLGKNRTFTTPSSVTDRLMVLDAPVDDLMFIKGDQTAKDFGYFEGMKSVGLSNKMPVLKTTGKNLLNMNDYGLRFATTFIDSTDNSITFTTTGAWGGLVYDFYLKPNQTYRISFDSPQTSSEIKGFIRLPNTSSSTIGGPKSYSFTTDSTGSVRFTIETPDAIEKATVSNIQIEEGDIKTYYEPYKSNILTVNEDVTLRGIDDVQDTLDCLTGEVVERIGETVFNGSESWFCYAIENDKETQSFYIPLPNAVDRSFISNTLKKVINVNEPGIDYECLAIRSGYLQLRIMKSKLETNDTNSLKKYLSQNPFTVQYQLATESIKTVDLTTVDQDGQPTKLKTFNDISYVEINADNIIPSVDMEVATKISETLSTLVLDHHDISETQNKLSQTIEEQTENTDATMMATTEIYEQTL